MAKLTYRDAGVDLELYDQAMAGIAPLARATHSRRVLDRFGGFASLFDLGLRKGKKRLRDPLLVTCTDGVGTKLKVAQLMNRHDTVGIDLVAMSVNDALCTGAQPLVFLDYIALPKDDPDLLQNLVKGIADGCLDAGCSLVGGETAILPDVYQSGDYDMAGFCAAVVERDQVVDGKAIEIGDVVLGLPSTGLHSNGYSLARKVAFDFARLSVDETVPDLNTTIGEGLLTPTRIYVKPVRALLDRFGKKGVIHGLAHITGEGIPGNLPRILPKGKRAFLDRTSWPVPPIFAWLQKTGGIDDAEMFTVFNMGIGFVLVVDRRGVDKIQKRLRDDFALPSHILGEIRKGPPAVEWAT